MASINSAGLLGIEAYPLHIEIHLSRGMPGWSTVGLAENAVKEAKDRVLSAIHQCGYDIPARKTTLNLAPADIRKTGTAFDLPIALGLLFAAGILHSEKVKDYLILGELSLSGKLRPIRGALAIASLAKELKYKGLILPRENLREAQVIQGIEAIGVSDLPEVIEFLLGHHYPSQELPPLPKQPEKKFIDFSEVKGQSFAKRALEIAAAGFHNVLMVGPPGTGKSMLATRLASILPRMSFEEQMAATKIYSFLGMLKPGQSLLEQRPFRSPHHSISDAGLIGGGKMPRPGEVSLAHHGVLFLDELTEFRRHVLESLRQPLENHEVTISRSMQSLSYPARFLLVTAMNPCPCGHFGNPYQECHCSSLNIQKYQARISGPLLDRIDLQIHVPALKVEDLTDKSTSEDSLAIRNRVEAAFAKQQARFESQTQIHSNAQMGPAEIQKHCDIDSDAENLLSLAIKKWGISARVYHRVLKVSRTIADLEGQEKIASGHVSEALNYRFNFAVK